MKTIQVLFICMTYLRDVEVSQIQNPPYWHDIDFSITEPGLPVYFR